MMCCCGCESWLATTKKLTVGKTVLVGDRNVTCWEDTWCTKCWCSFER